MTITTCDNCGRELDSAVAEVLLSVKIDIATLDNYLTIKLVLQDGRDNSQDFCEVCILSAFKTGVMPKAQPFDKRPKIILISNGQERVVLATEIVNTGLVETLGQARRLMLMRAVQVNGEIISEPDYSCHVTDIINKTLKIGRYNNYVFRWQTHPDTTGKAE